MKDFLKAHKKFSGEGRTRRELASYLGIAEDSVRRYEANHNLEPLPIRRKPRPMPEIKEDTFIITHATNASPVWWPVWENLLALGDHLGCPVYSVPSFYCRPARGDWFDSAFDDHMLWEDTKIGDWLVLTEVSKTTRPTVMYPLSGVGVMSDHQNVIVAHPQVALDMAPTLDGPARILATTGSSTVTEYTRTREGTRGAFNHTFGGLLVHKGKPYQLVADKEGTVHFLRTRVRGGLVDEVDVECIVYGDTHVPFQDPDVWKELAELRSDLNPKYQVFHDILDFYSRNHHHAGDDLLAYGKTRYDFYDSVEEELQAVADFLDEQSGDWQSVIVASNHDEALTKWLATANPKTDPKNALLYHKLKYLQLQNLQQTATGFETLDVLETCLREMGVIQNTRFLSRGESFTVKGIELSMHGDKGANGARGSARNVSYLPTKSIVGHSHTAKIVRGCWQVGLTARNPLDYAKGQASSWVHCCAVIYDNGKRSLIFL